MAELKNTDPSKISNKFAALKPLWRKVDALYGGTETMRLEGEHLLPRDSLEDPIDWGVRLNRTTLYNAYKRSIQQGVARLFQADIELTGYPLEVVTWAQDVDAQGRDITQFVKADAEDALNRGISYLLIDYPEVDYGTGVENILYTQADALKSGNRPYWVPIAATQVLAAYSKLVAGVEHLTHFRYMEKVLEVDEDGINEGMVDQVRIYRCEGPGEPVELEIWRKDEKGWAQKGSTKILRSVPKIPVVPLYGHRTGFFVGTPPLMDLAEMNIQWWQSSSEQRNILHYARIPFLHIHGWDQKKERLDANGKLVEETVELNIRRALITNGDKPATAAWVETSGTALAAGAADLTELEKKMDALGLSLSAPRSGNVTATENSINAAEANSMLKDIARGFSDSLEQALYLTAFYLDTPLPPEAPGRVVIDTSFAVNLTPEAKPATEQPAPKKVQVT